MDKQQAVARFAALSQETRLEIIRYLVKAGAEGASAGILASHVGVSASALSFHLSTLTHAGLVSSKRQSRQIIYTIDFEALGALITFLLEDCCEQNSELLTRCGITLETPCC
ncbi:MAG: metalloregulator ArsR/SmtB family transcription factor [Granulosicoccus sp.]|nr:metalloregulator ArsR/SmtB family transcription factor [Granulosicoccus sp.]